MSRLLSPVLGLLVLAWVPAMSAVPDQAPAKITVNASFTTEQEAGVAQHLIGLAGSNPPGTVKPFSIKAQDQTVKIQVTTNADGTMTIGGEPAGTPSPLATVTITTYINLSEQVVGMTLGNGMGNQTVVLISGTGGLTVMPAGTSVSAIPGRPVPSSVQLASASVPTPQRQPDGVRIEVTTPVTKPPTALYDSMVVSPIPEGQHDAVIDSMRSNANAKK